MWNITGLWFNPLIADGYALAVNAEDNRLYSFGKGQTDITVQAPMTSITAGTNVIIEGKVTDRSPGAPGTPAISDNDMTAWMQYLYQQQPFPSDATGVNVSLDAIDPNGNSIRIGNVASDASGAYSYVWNTPNISGKYTITATFPGSNSYFASSSETAVVVSDAATATASPTPPPLSMADTYFVPAIAGLFVLIIIVLVAVILSIIKKRP